MELDFQEGEYGERARLIKHPERSASRIGDLASQDHSILSISAEA